MQTLVYIYILCYYVNMKKYEKIYNEIIEKIDTDEYKLGDSIPSENELSTKFCISRVTVRKALTELKKDGYIYKQQGKESIVISKVSKPRTVLLILPNLFKYIFIDLIRGIEDTLRAEGIGLLIACSYNDQRIERSIIRNYLSVVDGIILEPTQAHNAVHSKSKTYSSLESIPTVCINSQLVDFEIPYLVLDDRKNMQKLTTFVLDNGCKRILILSKTDDLQGYSRLAGIKDVLAHSSALYKVVEFTTHDETQKLAEFAMLYMHFKPDCIMFYNDEYAYRMITNYNINPIFDDVLITGYDDTEYSNGKPFSFMSPSHPKGQMGEDAANMIIDLLSGNSVESITYESEFN